MAYTLEQYEALCSAIATGANMIVYGNKTVQYKSTADMMRVKAAMEKELGLSTPKPTRRYAQFSKGLNNNCNL